MRSRRQPNGHHRLARFPVAAMLVTIVLLAGAVGAHGQTAGARFTYELCDSALPGGNPPPASFVVNPGVPFTPFQTCAQPGGSIGITETGAAAASYAFWGLAIPATPGGYVESITASGSSSGLGPGNDHTYAYEQGWPQNNVGEGARVFANSEGEAPFYFSEPGLRILMNCDGNVAGGCGAGPTIAVHYIAAAEIDPNPPVVAKVEGPLLSGGILRGHQPLAATATDAGGGVSVVEMLVNGAVAPGAVPGSCAVAAIENPSYRGLAAYSSTPCPAALPGSWDLDTGEYPFHQGANTVQVCASDFATSGPPNTTCSPPQTVAVNNSCTESAVVGGQNLNADFQGASGGAVTVPFEHPADVTGELTSGAGDPISGATICVQAQVQESGTEPQTIATATTDANGGFSYEVPPGPNRRLLVGYRHDSFQVAKTLEFNSHAKPTIKLSKGRIGRGRKIKITGALPGPQAAGRVVVLQASSLHGRRWLTFRRATTGPKGGFRSAYRFGETSSTTTYRMRAVVPRQTGYPYEPGHSTPKRIKVLGPGAAKTDTKHTHGGRRHDQGSRRTARAGDDHRDCGARRRDRGAGGGGRRVRGCGARQDRGAQGSGPQGQGAQR